MAEQPPKSENKSLTISKRWSLDSAYDEAAAFEVVERVAFGHSLKEIEAEPDMVPASVFLSWMMRNPSLAIAFTRAREASAYVFEDETIALLKELRRKDDATANQIRIVDLLVQNNWRIAGRRNPNIFSEKASVQVVVPVQIVTSLDMGKQDAGAGTPEFPNVYELKADVPIVVDRPLDPATVDHIKLRKRNAGPLTGPGGKRLLAPRKRDAETDVEREARLKAEKRLRDARELRRTQGRKRMAKLRERKLQSKGSDE